jgi:hypothetical protein
MYSRRFSRVFIKKRSIRSSPSQSKQETLMKKRVIHVTKWLADIPVGVSQKERDPAISPCGISRCVPVVSAKPVVGLNWRQRNMTTPHLQGNTLAPQAQVQSHRSLHSVSEHALCSIWSASKSTHFVRAGWNCDFRGCRYMAQRFDHSDLEFVIRQRCATCESAIRTRLDAGRSIVPPHIADMIPFIR